MVSQLLLIEDDVETAEDIAGYFRNRGYDVSHCATGCAGLAEARQGDVRRAGR